MSIRIKAVRERKYLSEGDQKDLEYWLKKSPQERLAAVTFLVRQSIPKNMKMNRRVSSQKWIHDS